MVLGSVIVGLAAILFFGGVLSTPRDFSSPQTTIRILDATSSPLSGIEVGRNWYDSDCGTEGSDRVVTDKAGISLFPKVPASVGVLTGAGRKLLGTFGMCGAGSGTYTTVYVRYPGVWKVEAQSKPLQSVAPSEPSPVFDIATDSQSNTLANLTFPRTATNIDYVLTSRPTSGLAQQVDAPNERR